MTNAGDYFRSLKQSGLYLLTTITMVYTGYRHLDFAADGIENAHVTDMVNAAPIFLLIVAIIGLSISAFAGFRAPILAARIAFAGSIVGWGYYGIMFCTLTLAFSVGLFVMPLGVLLFLVPGVLLLYTSVYSRRIMNSAS